MLDPKKISKISERAEKRRQVRQKIESPKIVQTIEAEAKKAAKKLIPKAEKEVEKAAKRGLDKVSVYGDPYGILQNKIALIVTSHFLNMGFNAVYVVEEYGGCYYETNVVVYLRKSI
ncbi:MAG: hypothetical protein HYT62_02465 [Candidatus Yanofskybacteria bacterium]|nr:hypothetical protein [Candidatus Yanofskybacteria bacterium]